MALPFHRFGVPEKPLGGIPLGFGIVDLLNFHESSDLTSPHYLVPHHILIAPASIQLLKDAVKHHLIFWLVNSGAIEEKETNLTLVKLKHWTSAQDVQVVINGLSTTKEKSFRFSHITNNVL